MKAARTFRIRRALGKLTVVALLSAAAPANAESHTDKAGLDFAIFTATKTPPHRCFVPIVKPIDELSYWVPVIINRADSPLFAIDTGFTGNLLIPRGFLDLLRKKGDLTKLDRSGPSVTSTLADGSEITQETIIVREIILPGCRAFSNVRAIISPAGSIPLLGQDILSRFSSAGIDHKEGGLILVPEGLSP
jgi:predicted aspartyl protease